MALQKVRKVAQANSQAELQDRADSQAQAQTLVEAMTNLIITTVLRSMTLIPFLKKSWYKKVITIFSVRGISSTDWLRTAVQIN